MATLTRNHKHLATTLSTLSLDESTHREARAALERLPEQTAEFLRQILNTNYHYLPKVLLELGKKIRDPIRH